jgi:hypothetical protein
MRYAEIVTTEYLFSHVALDHSFDELAYDCKRVKCLPNSVHMGWRGLHAHANRLSTFVRPDL